MYIYIYYTHIYYIYSTYIFPLPLLQIQTRFDFSVCSVLSHIRIKRPLFSSLHMKLETRNFSCIVLLT